MKQSFISRLNRFLWAFLLISLPFTSFPQVSKLFRGSVVAPLSLIPLAVLLFSLILPQIIKSKSIPQASLPLFVFVLVGVLSIGASNFLDLPSFRQSKPLMNNLESLVTLGIGLCFYLSTIYMIKNEADQRETLRWINIGGLIIILFCIYQLAVWLLLGEYPNILYTVQSHFTINAKLYDGRVTAVALEPSWLAHQLNMLYLPLWIAFSVKKTSLYQKRVLQRFTVENLLLLGGVFALFASFSRIGWVTTLAAIAFLILRFADSRKSRLYDRWAAKADGRAAKLRRGVFNRGFWLLMLLLIGLLGFGGLKLLSFLDPKRMATVFVIFDFSTRGLLSWANRLEMAERFLYWGSAFITFLAHPLIGVGLGNLGYFFSQNLPSFGYGSPEILQQLHASSSLVNAKNLWVRLLAETGIFGFASFLAWLYLQSKISLKLEKCSGGQLIRAIGLAGVLIGIAFVFEGFSMDTFGLPYYWIGFGLVAGTSRSLDLASKSSIE